MTDFHCDVVSIEALTKHPNADTLSIVKMRGQDFPVIIRTGDFAEGDLAVYVPVDAIVPDTEAWAFLSGHRRIRAKKLRGVFSMGLLTKAPEGAVLGDEVAERLGITRYEPPAEKLAMGGDNERDPGIMPIYTDIEGLRRWPDVLQLGEEVVLTEKVHGSNYRACHDGTRLWVGSHRCIKADPTTLPPPVPYVDATGKTWAPKPNVWWNVARAYELEARLSAFPGFAIYGEIFGAGIQDLTYGLKDVQLRLFDVLDTTSRRYLDYGDFRAFAHSLGVETVPELHCGPWSTELHAHAEGKTTFGGADHVREGYVVRPIKERHDFKLGRVILKHVGENYLLRKGG